MNSMNQHMLPNYFSENLRVLRKKRNVSQEELAQQVGLNRGNIASYEKGTAEPKICNLLKLAEHFSISICDLLSRDLRQENGTASEPGPFPFGLSSEERGKISLYLQQAEELEQVVDSLHKCHCFKMKHLEDTEPRDLQTIATHFTQLYEVTKKLLHLHRESLEVVNRGCNPTRL